MIECCVARIIPSLSQDPLKCGSVKDRVLVVVGNWEGKAVADGRYGAKCPMSRPDPPLLHSMGSDCA